MWVLSVGLDSYCLNDDGAGSCHVNNSPAGLLTDLPNVTAFWATFSFGGPSKKSRLEAGSIVSLSGPHGACASPSPAHTKIATRMPRTYEAQTQIKYIEDAKT